MSSSSSRIARLKYASNKNYLLKRSGNKFKKSMGNLMAYGARTNTFYNQNKTKDCCLEEENEEEEEEEDLSGNIILKISPASSDERKMNPEIRSSLGIVIPKYTDSSNNVENDYWIPNKYYTLLHNVMFKSTMTDIKIVSYNADYVSLPPGQIGWDDSLFELAPGYLYYYVVLSSGLKKIPVNKYIPLVYLNKEESSNFTLIRSGPVRNNKNSNNTYETKIRLLVQDNDIYNKVDISGSALDI